MLDQLIKKSPLGSTPSRGLLWKFIGIDFALLGIFCVMTTVLWLKLPNEGVKLHGTVDLGVDLLGTRNDLIWFGGFGIAIFVINTLLGIILAKWDRIASMYLVVATGLIFMLLVATILFLFRLNRIF